jgi:hypothetical protein
MFLHVCATESIGLAGDEMMVVVTEIETGGTEIEDTGDRLHHTIVGGDTPGPVRTVPVSKCFFL